METQHEGYLAKLVLWTFFFSFHVSSISIIKTLFVAFLFFLLCICSMSVAALWACASASFPISRAWLPCKQLQIYQSCRISNNSGNDQNLIIDCSVNFQTQFGAGEHSSQYSTHDYPDRNERTGALTQRSLISLEMTSL